MPPLAHLAHPQALVAVVAAEVVDGVHAVHDDVVDQRIAQLVPVQVHDETLVLSNVLACPHSIAAGELADDDVRPCQELRAVRGGPITVGLPLVYSHLGVRAQDQCLDKVARELVVSADEQNLQWGVRMGGNGGERRDVGGEGLGHPVDGSGTQRRPACVLVGPIEGCAQIVSGKPADRPS